MTTCILAALVGTAVTDAVGLTSAYGLRSSERWVDGGGYRLDVRFPSVTRPGLASPFRIEVRHPNGFGQTVTVAVKRSYLQIWSVNGISPAPVAEVVNGPWIEWEFDRPRGDALAIAFDGRIERALHGGRDGAVRLIVDGDALATVEFQTRVMP